MNLYDELQEKGTVIIDRERAQLAYPCSYMDTSERLDEYATMVLNKGIDDQLAKDIDRSEEKRALAKENRTPASSFFFGASEEYEV